MNVHLSKSVETLGFVMLVKYVDGSIVFDGRVRRIYDSGETGDIGRNFRIETGGGWRNPVSIPGETRDIGGDFSIEMGRRRRD